MYDFGKILTGIIIFILVFSSPIWTNWLSPDDTKAPDIKYPANYKECVADKDYMKAYHMDLLNQWRDKVVRNDIRFLLKDGKPFLIDGQKAEMSLTKTCMRCHDNREEFCDQCHNYMEVVPYCWDCHVDKYTPSREVTQSPTKDESAKVVVPNEEVK